jgi:hypothetical protein
MRWNAGAWFCVLAEKLYQSNLPLIVLNMMRILDWICTNMLQAEGQHLRWASGGLAFWE